MAKENLGYQDKLNIVVNAAKTGLATITEGHTITFDHGAQIIYAGGAAYDFHTLTKEEYERLISVIGATGAEPQSLEAVIADVAANKTSISNLWEGLSGIVATGNETHNQLLAGISGVSLDLSQYESKTNTDIAGLVTAITGVYTGLNAKIIENHTGIKTNERAIADNASAIEANANAINGLHNQTVALDKATGYLTLSITGTNNENYIIHQDELTQKLESLTSSINTLSSGSTGLSGVLEQIKNIKNELQGVTGATGEYLNTLLDALTTLQLRAGGTGASNYLGIKGNLAEGTETSRVPLQDSLKHLASNISGNASRIEQVNNNVTEAITGVYTGLNAKIIANHTGILANASGIAANASAISTNASAISALQTAVNSKYNQTVTGTTGLVTVTSYGDHNENYVINQSLLNTKLDTLTDNLNKVITWEIVGAGS